MKTNFFTYNLGDSSEDDAKLLIINGFCEGITKHLDVEYSVEMTRLIRMILEDGKAIKEN